MTDPKNEPKLEQVGCVLCGRSTWKFFTDGKGRYEARCVYCGHTSKFDAPLAKESIKAIPLRQVL